MICPQASIIFIPINFLLLVYLMVLNIMHIHNVKMSLSRAPPVMFQFPGISKNIYIMYGVLVHHDINSLYINVGVLIGYQFSHTSKWSTECGDIVF